MRIINEKEHKKLQYDILCTFVDYCESRHLRYFLAYGTLIGAIRHNGFIPWDDDIDIHMPREDYDTLIDGFNRENENVVIKLISPLSKIARHPYVKIVNMKTIKIEAGIEYTDGNLGVDIDIFPLDGQPEDEGDFKKFCKKLKVIYRLHQYTVLDRKNFTYRSWILFFIAKYIFGGKKKLIERAYRLHKKYNYETSEYVGQTECLYLENGDRAHKKCFDNYKKHIFIDRDFRIPEGYDEVLKNFYGDYLSLPPIEEQIAHHDYEIYWKE